MISDQSLMTASIWLLGRRRLSDRLYQAIIAADLSKPLYRTYDLKVTYSRRPNWPELEFYGEATFGEAFPASPSDVREGAADVTPKEMVARPPLNAEYVLHLFLQVDEKDVVIGDLIEDYGKVLRRFDQRRADIWFYKEVVRSLFPFVRRALLRIGALVWLGQVLRRFIS